ncbi:TIGR01212 family radical SAM protein [Velocimicrobium porci]|uniref:TIGR01212 family radical SAM protein n=1 Tax=Velocimicrobium porci TaxID=2606634 RepID=A0A6L5XZC1_9FIRM|nr:TIGR01212 family radical SAM protein [Velocimicrobium porci]MSS63821.1 TIGR01212 family radical SAM protein [Velocimicrobium porci]
MLERKTWGEKRYYSLDYYLKQIFGEKVYKVALNGGMTCPNRDGKLDTRGCIFCSSGGSGDFAAPICKNVTEQINLAIDGIKKAKSVGNKFIAYFQAYTNTYAPIDHLERIFTEAINHPSIVALSIGTRPDCLGNDILDLLERLNKIKPVWIELGLQTCHDETARFIRRGYPLSVFDQAVAQLTKRNIDIIVHIIIGLPNETKEMLLETIAHVASLPIQGIKLQLLHVLKGTDLADYLGTFPILTMEQYIDWVISCLEHLPPDIVIHRLTGDGPKKLLLEPQWSSHKKMVMNQINRELKLRDTWQGRLI